MARILAYTSPARGHLYPIVPILQELRGRGHEIALRTLTSQVELASGLGFDASSIDPAIEHIEHHDYLARAPIGADRGRPSARTPSPCPPATPPRSGRASLPPTGRSAGFAMRSCGRSSSAPSIGSSGRR